MYKDTNKKIAVIIEARMTSTRLPGKVLLPLNGKPSLERFIERIKKSEYLDEIIVATTIKKTDEPIVKLCKKLGIKYFCGSEEDVLSRVLLAAKSAEIDIIVELTGDCPLINGALIDRGIEEFFTHPVDYAANTIQRSYPDGFDVRIFPTAILEKVDKITQDPIDRVHVSYYIYNHPEKFRLHNWGPKEKELFWPNLRVTLDEKADYKLLDIIFKNLLPINENFSALDVVKFLKNNSHLLNINKNVRTKEASEG